MFVTYSVSLHDFITIPTVSKKVLWTAFTNMLDSKSKKNLTEKEGYLRFQDGSSLKKGQYSQMLEIN